MKDKPSTDLHLSLERMLLHNTKDAKAWGGGGMHRGEDVMSEEEEEVNVCSD